MTTMMSTSSLPKASPPSCKTTARKMAVLETLSKTAPNPLLKGDKPSSSTPTTKPTNKSSSSNNVRLSPLPHPSPEEASLLLLPLPPPHRTLAPAAGKGNAPNALRPHGNNNQNNPLLPPAVHVGERAGVSLARVMVVVVGRPSCPLALSLANRKRKEEENKATATGPPHPPVSTAPPVVLTWTGLAARMGLGRA